MNPHSALRKSVGLLFPALLTRTANSAPGPFRLCDHGGELFRNADVADGELGRTAAVP
jgi:hypothetical protein